MNLMVNQSLADDLLRCPQYSREELIELGRRWKDDGDCEARSQMIQGVMPFAVRVALSYRGRGLPHDELISLALEGIVIAADKFDPHRNVAFTTYARCWILERILKAIAEDRFVIRLPRYKPKKRKLQDAIGAVCRGIGSLEEVDD